MGTSSVDLLTMSIDCEWSPEDLVRFSISEPYFVPVKTEEDAYVL